MWLLPLFSPIARLALGTFYRFRMSGAAVPAVGPVLLVANHPNSLLDPAALVAVADRPVRFLAKAPLFIDPRVGWLVRGAGAIPVHRRADDPSQMDRNAESFRAALDALAAGDAVGIFPEGISHDEPALAPLRTGAARIALGAAAASGRAIPILPVGLSLRDKDRFRSDGLAMVGPALDWDDLAARGSDDPAAVRELTARIDRALRAVTLNLARWHDAPLVELAAEVFLAERGFAPDPASRAAGAREAAAALERLRADEDASWTRIADALRRHGRRLERARLGPAELDQPSGPEAARWLLRTVAAAFPAAALVLVGTALFYLPYRLTDLAAARGAPLRDVRATYKVLSGAVIFSLWIAAVALAVGLVAGLAAGAAALVLLPLLAFATVGAVGWWRRNLGAIRRYLLRSRRGAWLRELQTEQAALAERIAALRQQLGRGP